MNTIGSRIKAIRGKLRQDAFANKIGMHINTVGRWERGQRTPDVNDLNRILQACPDISPAWLLTGEGEKTSTHSNRYPENNELCRCDYQTD